MLIHSRFLATGFLFLLTATLITIPTSDAFADKIEAASGPTLSKASGHWSRARTHLLAAIREFDKGNRIVDPESLMDSKRFRALLLDRVVDLDRVLSPQPRISETGVRFDAAPELLGKVE